ncbi:hypothetical protein DF185_09320 [Marinifilum breve]|uniref:DUF4402 domain-containing protein n=1 Tax=Marinifilum breve TaxID=2184082 RepID=A0A2V4A1C7_9BACT|nr:hypothetical protein [Marinifilum breve]PXY01657.1 hypothetical protein DF185_09320 [Marinifilum breve]
MKRKIVTLAMMVFASYFGFAQDSGTASHTLSVTVPEVAILDLESPGTTAIALSFTAPTEAGMGVEGSSNSDLWLNYSSIKSTVNPTRTVNVQMSKIIPGADIKVAAAAHAGTGEGAVGTPAGELTLTTSAQTLVNGIGSCYTGDGVSNGHNLTYSLVVGSDYSALEKTNEPVTITYTISN